MRETTILVTVLVENTVHGRDLMAEHGLAFHIEAGPQRLLFDTGQSALLAHNAPRLGIDLSQLGALALSHGHYDHTGGLPALAELAPYATLHVHPAALAPRYAQNPDGTTRPVGISESSLAILRARAPQVLYANARTEVLPGFFLSGEIPRATDFEDVGGPFVLDELAERPDLILDDQALFFDTRDGLVVLLGCAHAGVVNTLRHVRQLLPGRPIHAVLGGMHLLNASSERMTRTVEALRDLGVRKLGPAHCTGAVAAARLWHEFPEACAACAVGSRFTFYR
jgi:7,8-dihydropterin-6-yl-methyl-4-(beta-D-ribofuranosyl)aminobenzene 5'-phosphate synthase